MIELDVEDLDLYLEANTLDTEEVLEKDITILYSQAVMPDDIISGYGNRTIYGFDTLYRTLERIPGQNSIISIIQINCHCTRQQAITKLALALNIEAGKDTWFKEQLETIIYNQTLLDNPELVEDTHPALYNQIKNGARMRKYYQFVLSLFMSQLEQAGLFYKGFGQPLVASASKRFVAKALHVRPDTAEDNMNNLDKYGIIKKLSDDEVMNANVAHYERVMSLKNQNKAFHSITTYKLIKWTDAVLNSAENHIRYCKETGQTNKSQTKASLDAHGYKDTIAKANCGLSEEDSKLLKALETWARNKYRSKKAVISTPEWEQKFNEFNTRQYNSAQERNCKSQELRTIIVAKLDLILITANKKHRALYGGANSRKWIGLAYNTKLMVKRDIYETLVGAK